VTKICVLLCLQVIQQAQHFFIRKCTECVLDTIAKEIKDPLITTHWNALNSPMQSCVKINIIAHGYDTVCRTSLLLHVADKSLKCITRDGRVVQMSYEMQELRDFMYCQVIFSIKLKLGFVLTEFLVFNFRFTSTK
jgi:mediator of RNA polymerase II transcription subunit 17